MRVLVYREGLVLLAGKRYQEGNHADFSDIGVHLTNSAVAAKLTQNKQSQANVYNGTRLLTEFLASLTEQETVWNSIKDVVTKVCSWYPFDWREATLYMKIAQQTLTLLLIWMTVGMCFPFSQVAISAQIQPHPPHSFPARLRLVAIRVISFRGWEAHTLVLR